MKSTFILLALYISNLLFAAPIICSNLNAANFISGLSQSIEASTDESINCKALTKNYLEYSKSLAMRVTDTKVLTNFTYYFALKKYKKDNQNLREGLQGLSKIHPEFMNKCSFTPGDSIDPPFLGEPTNICLVGAVYYDLALKKASKSDALNEAANEVFFASAQLPGENASKILNYINEDCLTKNKDNIDLYDIPVFENNTANFAFFYNDNNKGIRKNLDNGNPFIPDKINISCTKALEKIDEQSKHWHSIVSAIDTSYRLTADKSLKGTPDYKQFSYKYVPGHLGKGFDVFPAIMRMASLILSSNGYINKNIEAYESQCLSDEDASPVYKVEKKDNIEYVVDEFSPKVKNLNSSMDSMAAKEFNNFTAPALPSREPNSDQASTFSKSTK